MTERPRTCADCGGPLEDGDLRYCVDCYDQRVYENHLRLRAARALAGDPVPW